MFYNIFYALRRVFAFRIGRISIVFWGLGFLLLILFHDVVAYLTGYAAAIGIALAGISLIAGGWRGRRWCTRLLIFSLICGVVSVLFSAF